MAAPQICQPRGTTIMTASSFSEENICSQVSTIEKWRYRKSTIMTQQRNDAVLNEPVERRSANFQLMLLSIGKNISTPLKQPTERRESNRLKAVQRLLIDAVRLLGGAM